MTAYAPTLADAIHDCVEEAVLVHGTMYYGGIVEAVQSVDPKAKFCAPTVLGESDVQFEIKCSDGSIARIEGIFLIAGLGTRKGRA